MIDINTHKPNHIKRDVSIGFKTNTASPIKVFLILTIVAVAARCATFNNPVIGFDEQFYLLVGDQMLHGAWPFVDVFDRKPVGLFLIFAAIRLLGGTGFLAYKFVALTFVVGTAFGIFTIARRLTGNAGALAGATLYICWLDFTEGEGGQAPVFYNLLMIAAALMTLAAIRRPDALRLYGATSMVLIGLALQVKYSVIFEGVYIGCVLIWVAALAGQRYADLVTLIALWVTCALTPTIAAMIIYAVAGHFSEFWFCNFVSVLYQQHGDAVDQLLGAAVIAGILLPLFLVLLTVAWGAGVRQMGAERAFVFGWLVAAVLGVVLFGRFASPHYALPVLVPLTIALAPALYGSRRRRITAIVLIATALVAGQFVLALSEKAKGGASAAHAVALAAHSDGGCIFVYDGYPALYMLTNSCVPTRWAFPGSLNTADEANPKALGIDPATEVSRIFSTHPRAVIDDYPRFDHGDSATRAVVDKALARDYFLSACIATGPHRLRLVYRPRSEPRHQPTGRCPSAGDLRGSASGGKGPGAL